MAKDQNDAPSGLPAFHVGDPIPQLLTREQLAGLLQISTTQVDAYRRSHSHPGIKRLAGPGHPRFSGQVFRAWRDGETAGTARRFFGRRKL